MNRRELFELLGGGVVFQIALEGAAQNTIGSRLHIAPDGIVTLLTGKVELGQGCRTLLSQCVAEELGVEVSKVRVVMGDTSLVPDDGGTFASLTTPLAVPVIRQAAAAAREMLKTTKPEAAMLREIPVKVTLTAPEKWSTLGASVRNVNGRDIVTGSLKYSGDLKIPGMLAGKAVRPEAYSAELASFDGSAAERLPGVKVVRDGGFLGVVAADEATAEKAAKLVRAEWVAKDNLLARAELFAHFKKTSAPPVANMNTRYPPLLEKGDVKKALAVADKKHEAAYTLPAIAHAPVEPRAAVAYWDEKGLTVRGASQVPFGVRKQLAAAFGIPETQVRLIVTEMGGGFGGKHGPEVMLEAARLAKAAGKPVKVAWTREEEFVRSYCRPAALVEVKSGLSGGRIIAWDFKNYHSGAASLATPYAIPDYSCGFHRADSPLRQGPYRSLAAVANTFARESHVDELAALAGQDSVEFRLRNLENPRMKEVVQRAAERFGWGKGKSAAGMACNLEKGGHMALFVEMDGVRLLRATIAFDCGAVLNPDNLRNQIAGATIMGMGGALFEELRYDKAKILNAKLSQYRVPRFSDAPEIEVILVDRRGETPSGAGESPITVAAPAIAAALFRANGKRLRALPLAASSQTS